MAKPRVTSGGKPAASLKKPRVSKPGRSSLFPIVGIGASAGGLEAISQLLTRLPTDTGLALVVVQHLDPTHESFSAEILSRVTKMPVEEIRDRTRVQPNHVYIIPPNCNLAILHGVLNLMPRAEARGQHMAVDYFFQSLALDRKNRAIGIVLSGTGHDGTLGLEAIKSEGGLAIVQDPVSAKYDGMPHSAIAAGAVDLVLRPEQIAEELVRFAYHPLLSQYGKQAAPSLEAPTKLEGDSLAKIFTVLRNQSHVDFTHYKLTTIKRRIARRMVIHKVKKLDEYFSFLQAHPLEVRALFSDILINVTEFFRDPEVYVALKKQVLSKIVKNRTAGAPIRIWVVGCATGEETYSVAISLLELLGDEAQKTAIQIFATDISEPALQKARAGVYPESILKNVSKERLNRFFEKTEAGYKVLKFIRDMCLFSRHDVTGDPPFSKIDLICCRNLLIYFDAALQRHVLPILHYAMKPDGYLWLGRSESVGSLTALFRIVDKPNRIYSRGASTAPPRVQFGLSQYLPAEGLGVPSAKHLRAPVEEPDLQRAAEQALISKYAPPGVLVDGNMDIVLVRGETEPFLKLRPGQASLSLFKMARQDLVSDLRIAIQRAKKLDAPFTKEDLSLREGEKQRFFNISVIPVLSEAGKRERHFWIVFEPAAETVSIEPSETAAERKRVKRPTWRALELKDRQIAGLQEELSEAKAFQQSVAEDHEATREEITSANEELQSTNEELQSTNEELQSTNEELETAKEELQSTNEELSTVNDELQSRNNELSLANSDLLNLLGSVDFPIVMVAGDGRLRRFTPAAGKLLNLIATDVGRPIGDIRPGFDEPNLQSLVEEVMESITPIEREVKNREGRSFRLQVRPYKTADNRIDGAVISLVDITLLKGHLTASEAALKYATTVADTLPLPLVVLDEGLRLLSANRAFAKAFKIVPEENVGETLKELAGPWGGKTPRIRDLLLKVISEDQELRDFEVEYDSPESGHRTALLNAQQIKWQDTMPKALLMSIADNTERRSLERALAHSLEKEKEAHGEAERANEAKNIFLATLSHELRTPLTAILSWAQLLKRLPLDPEKLKQGLNTIELSAHAQGQLINDVLDISRIQTGKLAFTLSEVEPDTVVRAAVESIRPMAESKNIAVTVFDGAKIGSVRGDPARLQQVIWNLLTNSIKFSSDGSKIEVHVAKVREHGRSYASIRVVDHGKGIDPAFLPNIFTRFSQQDSTSTRVHGGLGIGLSLVHDLVKSHNGSVRAESPGVGKGATFTVLLPLIREEAPAEKRTKPAPKLAPPDLSYLKVLIVDDDPKSLEAFAEIVKTFGGKAIKASSVREAMIAFVQSRPDVVVSDIAMPVEDGYTLIAKIRSRTPEQGGQVPALALTAYAAQHDIARVVTAGFQEHMAKPVDSDDLGHAIARLAKAGSAT